MGVRSDLDTGTVAGIHTDTGYPMDRYGHLLDPLFDGYTPWKKGTELYNLTSPYGHLHFAIESGDDFVCYDYATITGPRGAWIVLHAVRNSETGSFIEGAEYIVLPINTKAEKIAACRVASGMADLAFEDTRHDRKGWNQDWDYFGRAVFCNLFDFECRKYNRRTGEFENWVTDRMKRFGGKRIRHLMQVTLSEV